MLPYDPSQDALYRPYLHPTLLRAGQAEACTLPQLGAELARLAYMPAERDEAWHQRLGEALALAGFQAPRIFHDADTGSQGFAALRPADGLAVVAFRGTEPQDGHDLISDIDFWPTDWPEAQGHVHRGFARATRALLTEVQAWLTAHPHQQLLLCGHSLGAAMATLAASVLQPTRLVTLGSPRVGDAAFAASVRGIPTNRFVNGCDVVTEVPPSLPGARYVHTGPATFIDAEGQVHADVDTASEHIAHQRSAMRLAYPKAYGLKPGQVPLRDLADHAPINYLRALFPG